MKLPGEKICITLHQKKYYDMICFQCIVTALDQGFILACMYALPLAFFFSVAHVM